MSSTGHDRDHSGICRKCGAALSAWEIVTPTPCRVETTATIIDGLPHLHYERLGTSAAEREHRPAPRHAAPQHHTSDESLREMADSPHLPEGRRAAARAELAARGQESPVPAISRADLQAAVFDGIGRYVRHGGLLAAHVTDAVAEYLRGVR